MQSAVQTKKLQRIIWNLPFKGRQGGSMYAMGSRNRFNRGLGFPCVENLYNLSWGKLALFRRQSNLILVLDCPVLREAYNSI